jgi:GNAT superfamily N-acetyltransferase
VEEASRADGEGDVVLREVPFGGEDYRALLAVRDAVLRRPIGMALRPKDVASDPGDTHLAAFAGATPVACVLLTPLEEGRVQLRQMAVADAFRGRDIGARLARFAEDVAARRGFTMIETRARRVAEGFYRKLGYASLAHLCSDEHTLLMRKPLTGP